MNFHPHISVAPMMDYTDRHFRFLLRLIAPHVRLYTEMITASALIHGNAKQLLAFNTAEKYLALQVGGSDPQHLAYSARLGEEEGYDEINLNAGCPSPRVSSGRFGACLMLEPQHVADCMAAMQSSVKIPVTIKCRIGVDQQDSYEALHHFITLISQTGCKTFIIHARKAWLKGLSPKQNREIPPLQYEVVRSIKQDFPFLSIILNGGIKTIEQMDAELPFVDGIMIGREACSRPYFLAQIEKKYFQHQHVLSQIEVVRQFLPYIQAQLQQGTRLNSLTRHLLGLFQGQRGASAWRRKLSENSYQSHAGIEVVEEALTSIA